MSEIYPLLDKASILAIHTYLQNNPIASTKKIKETCGISLPTVIRNLEILESLGIVKETTGKERHKIYIYMQYLSVLSEGTEPIR